MAFIQTLELFKIAQKTNQPVVFVQMVPVIHCSPGYVVKATRCGAPLLNQGNTELHPWKPRYRSLSDFIFLTCDDCGPFVTCANCRSLLQKRIHAHAVSQKEIVLPRKLYTDPFWLCSVEPYMSLPALPRQAMETKVQIEHYRAQALVRVLSWRAKGPRANRRGVLGFYTGSCGSCP